VKIMAERWNTLTPDEKEKYTKLNESDKERYAKEMEAYQATKGSTNADATGKKSSATEEKKDAPLEKARKFAEAKVQNTAAKRAGEMENVQSQPRILQITIEDSLPDLKLEMKKDQVIIASVGRNPFLVPLQAGDKILKLNGVDQKNANSLEGKIRNITTCTNSMNPTLPLVIERPAENPDVVQILEIDLTKGNPDITMTDDENGQCVVESVGTNPSFLKDCKLKPGDVVHKLNGCVQKNRAFYLESPLRFVGEGMTHRLVVKRYNKDAENKSKEKPAKSLKRKQSSKAQSCKSIGKKPTSKKEKKIRDPNCPKKPKNPFLYYVEDMKAQGFVQRNPSLNAKEVLRALADKWGVESSKEKWEAKANADKKRYQIEMTQYKQTKEAECGQPVLKKPKTLKSIEGEDDFDGPC